MSEPVSVICVGGAAIDRKYYSENPVRPETSNPVRSHTAYGGVARNVAENLARLDVSCRLLSAVGDDSAGRRILEHLRSAGVQCDDVLVLPASTAEYAAALNPDGSLAVAFADMAIFDSLTPERLAHLQPHLDGAEWTFADCNLPAESLREMIAMIRGTGCRLAVDTVSVAKSSRLPDDLSGIDLLFANHREAAAILNEDSVTPAAAAHALRRCGAANAVVTLGAGGCIHCGPDGPQHVPATAADIADVTGAGDAMVAGVLAGLVAGHDMTGAVRAGMCAAATVVASTASTLPKGKS